MRLILNTYLFLYLILYMHWLVISKNKLNYITMFYPIKVKWIVMIKFSFEINLDVPILKCHIK